MSEFWTHTIEIVTAVVLALTVRPPVTTSIEKLRLVIREWILREPTVPTPPATLKILK